MSEVEPWLEQYLPGPSDRLALDIGANAGAWTIRLAPFRREVHAFEPNPQVLPILRGFMAARPNVRLFECAVGDTTGDLDLNLYASSAWASAYRGDELDAWRDGDSSETVRVPVVALDALGYEARPVDFVKVDVEGGECAVLRGAEATLRANRPALIVEVHSAANLGWCRNFLADLGYVSSHVPHPHAGVPEGHCWLVAEGE